MKKWSSKWPSASSNAIKPNEIVISVYRRTIIVELMPWFVIRANAMQTATFNTHFWPIFWSNCCVWWAILRRTKMLTTACISSAACYCATCNCCNSIRMKFSICWNKSVTISGKQFRLGLDCIPRWLCSIIRAIRTLSGKQPRYCQRFQFHMLSMSMSTDISRRRRCVCTPFEM